MHTGEFKLPKIPTIMFLLLKMSNKGFAFVLYMQLSLEAAIFVLI